MARGPQGQQVPVRVHEDLNHPMAGKTLVFDVKVLDIQPATSQPPQPVKPAQPAAPK
jgi:FKBP-type peptidyl-prolyl cis-trans isomerase 2